VEKPEQWERIKEIVGAALEKEASERPAFLDTACAQDSSLRAEVESLVAAYEVADELSEHPWISQLGIAQVDHVIGPYKLLKKLGEGGMGQVWLADQMAPVRRKVALKLIRSGTYDESVLQRFKSEQQSLAMMDHPAIAKVFDAGTTASGQPYFAMEYVEGSPITAYCDRKRLGIRERLELFFHVCEGVQHAHQKAIIHRDLKPANILVVEIDGKPMPRIIDFGLAKAAAAALNSEACFTQVGVFLGTPGYMSPEQVDPGFMDVDTRTDVYSLGVVLYELLTGDLPFDSSLWKKLRLDEVLRKLREEDPPRPSTKVTADRETFVSRASVRGTVPAQLPGLLRGDLDWITMKAIEKDCARRYATPTELANDIRRHLRHEPISARPDTVAYRATRFVRRNRAAVSLTATALTLVIASLSTGLYVANRERKTAERRFIQVRQLANKFIDLDNQIRGLPGSTDIRKRMVSDSLQYLTSLGNEVRGDKDLALEIATAYVRVAHVQGDPTSPNLGQFADAEATLKKGEDFVQSVLAADGRNQPGLAIAATIAHDRMILADVQGRRADVLSLARTAEMRVERLLNLGNMDTKYTYGMAYFELNIGFAFVETRHFDDALRVGRRALDITQPVPSTHKLHGGIFELFAFAFWQLGNLEKALDNSHQSIAIDEKEAARGHAAIRSNLAGTLLNEGMLLGKEDGEPSLGQTADALADFQRAMSIAEELSKKDPEDSMSRHKLARVGLEMGNILRHSNPAKALKIYDRALASLRESKLNLQSQHDQMELLAGSSYAARWVGRNAQANQRIESAFQLLRDAHEYPASKVEPMSPLDHTVRALADEYVETGQTVKALTVYQELLDKLMAWKPDIENDLRDATCISRTWTALAEVLRRAGRKDEAVRLETQRGDLWNHWRGKLPNSELLLRQSLRQTFRATALQPHS